jgi:hypothetical protein
MITSNMKCIPRKVVKNKNFYFIHFTVKYHILGHALKPGSLNLRTVPQLIRLFFFWHATICENLFWHTIKINFSLLTACKKKVFADSGMPKKK